LNYTKSDKGVVQSL